MKLKGRILIILCIVFVDHHIWCQTDECISAPVLLIFDDCRLSPGSTADLTRFAVDNACGGNTDDDGWFQFKAVSTMTSIQVFSGQRSNMAIGVYLNCDQEVECIDGTSMGGTEILDVATQPGMDYYVQVFDVDEGSGEFTICITNKVESPESDCSGAEVVCQDGQINFTPVGSGLDDFENVLNQPGCLLDKESQSAWYYFEILTTAPPNQLLTFTLTPENSPDYDFAIFGPNAACDELGYPIRCSWADASCLFCPLTGLGMESLDASESSDGDGFVAPLLVQPGEGYFLLVDNYWQNATGFMLDWGGPAAEYLNCDALAPCGIIVNAGNPIQVCDEAQVVLNGSALGVSTNAIYQWEGLQSTTSYLNDITVANPTVTLPVDFTGRLQYILSVSDNDCLDADVVTITKECFESDQEKCSDRIHANFDLISPECSDDLSGSIQVGHIYGGKAPYLYRLNNQIFQAQTFFPNLFAGQHIISIEDSRGCVLDTSLLIPQPEVPTLSLGDDIVVFQGASVELRVMTNIPSKQIRKIEWSGLTVDNCPQPCLDLSITPLASVSVVATLEAVNGCVVTDEVRITVQPKVDIYIPSAFSPNGDGVNDIFAIFTGPGITNIKSMRVYDRWGGLLFLRENFPPNLEEYGWDGKFNNQFMHTGMFVYLVELEMPDQSIRAFAGDLVILRF